MSIIRWLIGSLILFFDWLFTPRGVKRDPAEQNQIDQQTAKLSLYQFKACPFCVKVRRAMKRQTLSIKTLDAKRCPNARQELLENGGKVKVPCLKIEDDQGKTEWLYESSAIISYLNQRFSG